MKRSRFLSASRLRGVLVVCALLSTQASSAEPTDADKAQARQLVGDGLKALRAKDYEAAFRAFSSADKLYHAPTTLLGVARSQAGLKHLVAAQEAYNRLIREPLPPNPPEAFVNAFEDAKKELAELTPRVPTVVIQVKGPTEPQVTIDGEQVSVGALGFKRPVDPGRHVVAVNAGGYLPAKTEFSATEGKGEPESVTITMVAGGTPVASASASAPRPLASAPVTTGVPAVSASPPPFVPPPPPPAATGDGVPTAAYIGWGVGGAGLVVGVVAGVLAMGKKSDLDVACQGNHCPASAGSTHDSFRTLGLVSTIGFAAAIVGGGVGTAFFFTAPREPRAGLTVSPTVGLGSVGFRGAF